MIFETQILFEMNAEIISVIKSALQSFLLIIRVYLRSKILMI